MDDETTSAGRGENVREGMARVRAEGGVTGRLPVGYRLVRDSLGGKRAEEDPFFGPLVTEAFRLASGGRHSLAMVAEFLRSKGWANAEGKAISTGTLHLVLHNESYLRGVGGAEPLVDAATFYRAQGAMAARAKGGLSAKPMTRDQNP